MSRSTLCLVIKNASKEEIESRLASLNIEAKYETNIAHPNTVNVEFEKEGDKVLYMKHYPTTSN